MSNNSFLDMFINTNNNNNFIGVNSIPTLQTNNDSLLDLFSSSIRLDSSIKHSNYYRDKRIFLVKLERAFNDRTNDNKIDPLMIAFGFYLRDIKEKGERTLFYLFFIKLWEKNEGLAKRLIKFITGFINIDNSEKIYFGSWKDLGQILLHANIIMDNIVYKNIYEHFIEIIGIQLSKDWIEYIEYIQGWITTPEISLCAKWMISYNKHLDVELLFNNRSFVGNFCKYNTDRIIEMVEFARSTSMDWKRVKKNDYYGLQKAIRKIKSILNQQLETPEQKMCMKKWSDIKPSRIPSRNLTIHRRAFYNEKAVILRNTSITTEFGDKDDDIINNLFPLALKSDLQILKDNISNISFRNKLFEFKEKYYLFLNTNSTNRDDIKIASTLDRILCRLQIINSTTSVNNIIHGTRSDIGHLVIAALSIDNTIDRYSSDISQWTDLEPERALLHLQVEDKIKEIREEISKSLQSISSVSHNENDIRINLNNVIGLYDVSSSMMYGSNIIKPIHICIGLAYVISKLTITPIRNPVGITFDSYPQMFNFRNDLDFVSAINHIKGQSWGAHTDFVKAYKLILNYARDNNLSQEQIPEAMIVISDMQFDMAQNRRYRYETTYQTLKNEFERYGYKLPLLIFWNVNGRYRGHTTNSNQHGVVTISGYDSAIFKTILEAGVIGTRDNNSVITLTPRDLMIRKLTSDRYKLIIKEVDNYFNQEINLSDVSTEYNDIDLVNESWESLVDESWESTNDSQSDSEYIY